MNNVIENSFVTPPKRTFCPPKSTIRPTRIGKTINAPSFKSSSFSKFANVTKKNENRPLFQNDGENVIQNQSPTDQTWMNTTMKNGFRIRPIFNGQRKILTYQMTQRFKNGSCVSVTRFPFAGGKTMEFQFFNLEHGSKVILPKEGVFVSVQMRVYLMTNPKINFDENGNILQMFSSGLKLSKKEYYKFVNIMFKFCLREISQIEMNKLVRALTPTCERGKYEKEVCLNNLKVYVRLSLALKELKCFCFSGSFKDIDGVKEHIKKGLVASGLVRKEELKKINISYYQPKRISQNDDLKCYCEVMVH